MTEEQFKNLKIGDVVTLSSSSKKMTVVHIDETFVSVMYFSDAGIIESRQRIPYEALTKSDG